MFKKFLYTLLLLPLIADCGINQTDTVTPILPPDTLPYIVEIEQADFQLPNGWQAGVVALQGNKAVLLAGRTNGLHGFDPNPHVNNFPPSAQNDVVYVIDFKTNQIWQKSLYDESSGLTQEQIDTLTVTSAQFYQSGKTLYITGGYGINTATGKMETKPVLSAIDIPGLIKWVTNDSDKLLSKSLRQVYDPLVQVTGGAMYQLGPHDPTLLIFGQNFTGLYREGSNGAYTKQVRSFRILDNGKELFIVDKTHQPDPIGPYRRRDLNVEPVMLGGKSTPQPAYVALSGVFTKESGIWTVPVIISPEGDSFMADPYSPFSFKQGMNNYASATVGLFSDKTQDMFMVLLGGLTYGYFENGIFKTDDEVPFTNQVTTVKIDKKGSFSQYLMENEYPTIYPDFSIPSNGLLFGTGAAFIPNHHLPAYQNGVLALDKFSDEETIVGYIVGGIQSIKYNTTSPADSAASPYIFKVTLLPRS